MVDRVTFHLHRFHLSSDEFLEFGNKGPPNVFYFRIVNLTISNAVLVAV